MKNGNITRGHFITKLWGLLLLPYALFALLASEKNRQLYSKQKLRIPNTFSPGISFFENVIVVNTDQKVRVFSSRCTHLGCQINKVENNELLCPCHGSAFSTDGKVMRGPAAEKLQSLSFQMDDETNEIVIDL